MCDHGRFVPFAGAALWRVHACPNVDRDLLHRIWAGQRARIAVPAECVLTGCTGRTGRQQQWRLFYYTTILLRGRGQHAGRAVLFHAVPVGRLSFSVSGEPVLLYCVSGGYIPVVEQNKGPEKLTVEDYHALTF